MEEQEYLHTQARRVLFQKGELIIVHQWVAEQEDEEQWDAEQVNEDLFSLLTRNNFQLGFQRLRVMINSFRNWPAGHLQNTLLPILGQVEEFFMAHFNTDDNFLNEIVNNGEIDLFEILDIAGSTTTFINFRVPSNSVLMDENELMADPFLLVLAYALCLEVNKPQSPVPSIKSVSTNWLWAGAPHGTVSGGPGGYPIPVPIPPSEDDVNITPTPIMESSPSQEIIEAVMDAGRVQLLNRLESKLEEAVHIYVLDTIPALSNIEYALNHWTGPTPLFTSNWLMSELLHNWTEKVSNKHYTSDYLDIRYYDDENDAGFIYCHPPDYYAIECYGEHAAYEMEDHGLFVAGIIHSVLRQHMDQENGIQHQIHLIEVLNQYGIGSSRSVIKGLARTIADIPEGRKAVINCSLTIGFDFNSIFSQYNKACIDPGFIDFSASTEILACSLDLLDYKKLVGTQDLLDYNKLVGTLDFLFQNLRNDIAVLAAAGNDRKLVTVPGGEIAVRYPASFNRVAGIGALTKGTKPAMYTNIPDRRSDEGFWAFGGDSIDDDAGAISAGGVSSTSPVKGMIGIYTCSAFPVGSEPNKNGWARWCGTSFATPVASGFFAHLMSQNVSWTMVMNHLENDSARVNYSLADSLATESVVDRPIIPYTQG